MHLVVVPLRVDDDGHEVTVAFAYAFAAGRRGSPHGDAP